jgi:N-acetyl-gamma-glutamyl-phosphate reductase
MKIGLIGGSGYAGGELLRLLAAHPHFEVVAISAHSNAGEEITSIHPQLQSYLNLRQRPFKRASSSFSLSHMVSPQRLLPNFRVR